MIVLLLARSLSSGNARGTRIRSSASTLARRSVSHHLVLSAGVAVPDPYMTVMVISKNVVLLKAQKLFFLKYGSVHQFRALFLRCMCTENKENSIFWGLVWFLTSFG